MQHAIELSPASVLADNAGVMDASYARQRIVSAALKFRLCDRAHIVSRAWKRFGIGASPHVLDLGAAEGRTLIEIARQIGHGEYTGIELDPGLLAAAKLLPNGMRLIQGNVCELPAMLEDETFELASLLAVLEHLPNPALALQEARRMLRPGGLLVATCPNPFWDGIAGRLGLVRGDHHLQQLDLASLSNVIARAGFEVLEARRFMWAPVASLPYLRLPMNIHLAAAIDSLVHCVPLLNQLCVNAYVVARKPRI